MRAPVFLLLLIGAMLAASWRLSETRERLAAQQRAVRDNWVRAEDALRNRAAVLPEVAPVVPPELAARLREAGAKATAAKSPADLIAASSALDDAVARWIVAVEAAPEKPTLDPVKEKLREAEFRFANERRRYNSALQSYNVSLEMFPGNLAGRIFGFRRDDAYFITELPRKR